MDTVNKSIVPKPQAVEVCLSCGLMMGDGPHGTSQDCIQALAAEVRRLSEQVKNLQSQKNKKLLS
jgi:hypothetical protein